MEAVSRILGGRRREPSARARHGSRASTASIARARLPDASDFFARGEPGSGGRLHGMGQARGGEQVTKLARFVSRGPGHGLMLGTNHPLICCSTEEGGAEEPAHVRHTAQGVLFGHETAGTSASICLNIKIKIIFYLFFTKLYS